MNSACCTRLAGVPAKYHFAGWGSGGRIVHRRCPDTGKIVEVDCFNRDGWRLGDCRLPVFKRLKRRRLIASHGGAPSRIRGPYKVLLCGVPNRRGLEAVRAQLDNR